MLNEFIRVLLVEDDEIDRDAMVRYVLAAKIPLKLITAVTQEEALVLLQKETYDIILLDYDPGAKTGDDFLARTGTTPIIFISPQADEKIAAQAIDHGTSDYVIKDRDHYYLTTLPVTIRAVLERKRVEQALKFYEHIVDAAGELMVVLDRNYTFQAANETFLKAHKTTRAEIIGRHVLDFPGTRYFMEIEKDKFERCLAGVKIHFDSWFDYAGLGNRFMDVFYHPFFEADGSVSGVLLVAHDITGRKRTEEERIKLEAHVQQVQKFESLNVMAGSIAHSFNNMLMGVLGNLELALKNLDKQSPVRRNIVNADSAARRVAELSKLMLTYVGQSRGETRILNLSASVSEMTGMMEAAISKNTSLKFALSAAPAFFKGDPTQIRQVIMNLVSNAAEAVGENEGTITLSTGRRCCTQDDFSSPFHEPDLSEGDYVYFEVIDNGCGMDKETLAKAFDPFFTTRFKGRGMGLAAVLGIARAYKGTVSLRSELGYGTHATVFFPAVESSYSAVVAPVNHSPQWLGTGTILLVDDEEMVRDVGKEMLEELGYYVLTACDGFEAIKLLRDYAKEVACVLLDMTMPRMSGENVFQQLRDIKENIPVILCSGYTEEQVAKRFVDELPAPFLGKPFKMPELRTVLQSVLTRHI